MNIDLGYCGISCFAISLPLEQTFESEYSSWLPEGLQNAAPIRRSEFIAGRYCAYRAGIALGAEIMDLPASKERAPIWPRGILGSISHSRSMAIACVGRERELRSVGIDTEELVSAETMESIKGTISNPGEALVLEKGGVSGPIGLTILFSAKESLFKALWPLYQTFFDFKEAGLTSLSLEGGTFSFKVKGLHEDYHGRFIIQEKNIITILPVNN